jgi:hypothetical protein
MIAYEPVYEPADECHEKGFHYAEAGKTDYLVYDEQKYRIKPFPVFPCIPFGSEGEGILRRDLPFFQDILPRSEMSPEVVADDFESATEKNKHEGDDEHDYLDGAAKGHITAPPPLMDVWIAAALYDFIVDTCEK